MLGQTGMARLVVDEAVAAHGYNDTGESWPNDHCPCTGADYLAHLLVLTFRQLSGSRFKVLCGKDLPTVEDVDVRVEWTAEAMDVEYLIVVKRRHAICSDDTSAVLVHFGNAEFRR